VWNVKLIPGKAGKHDAEHQKREETNQKKATVPISW